ncbi:MAG: alanine racemase, partial [Candidatus Eisenbacteria bacterium]|nr:alanine racemase [Candidatus Eisenbacteria bacterium]
MPTNSTALTWLEIKREALLGNLQAFRQRIGPAVELVHVIKSNAYGHGLELVGQAVESANAADRFAVISVEELLRLRKVGITKPIMVLGYVSIRDLPELVSAKGIPVLSSEASLVALSSAAKDVGVSVKVHLKVETGTHRYGFDGKELESVLNRIPNLPGIELEGLATHFANIEDTTDHSFAEGQLQTYVDLLAHARSLGLEVPVPNAACSAAAILFPKANFGLVRVGIASYGIWPSKQTKVSAQHVPGADLSLRPVLSWKTTVAQVKDVPAGGYVGYGCSWRASAPTKLAVLPVGYADGYDRELSN